MITTNNKVKLLTIDNNANLHQILNNSKYKQLRYLGNVNSDKWGIYVNPEKEKAAIFSRNRTDDLRILIGMSLDDFSTKRGSADASLKVLESELERLNLLHEPLLEKAHLEGPIAFFKHPLQTVHLLINYPTNKLTDNERLENVVRNGKNWYGAYFGKEAAEYLELNNS